jgi:hypothetical protein
MLTPEEKDKLEKIQVLFDRKKVTPEQRTIIVSIADPRKTTLDKVLGTGDADTIKKARAEHRAYIKEMLGVLQAKSTESDLDPPKFKVAVIDCYRQYCICVGNPSPPSSTYCQDELTKCLALNP